MCRQVAVMPEIYKAALKLNISQGLRNEKPMHKYDYRFD